MSNAGDVSLSKLVPVDANDNVPLSNLVPVSKPKPQNQSVDQVKDVVNHFFGAAPIVKKPLAPPKHYKETGSTKEALRYGLAGFGKIPTMIPALGGVIGAAGKTFNNLLWKEDADFRVPGTIKRRLKELTTDFGKQASEGVSGDLIKLGFDLSREYVSDPMKLNLHPKRTGNQIADIIGGLTLPVPAGFLGGATAKGAAGLAGKATTLMTPAIRMGPKGNRLNIGVKGQANVPTRAGVQYAIGGGIDQGIRWGIDNPELPLMFSEAALTGKDPNNVPLSQLVIADDNNVPLSSLEEPVNRSPNVSHTEDLKMDTAMLEAAHEDTYKTIAATLGTLAIAFGGYKYAKYLKGLKTPPIAHNLKPISAENELIFAQELIQQQPKSRWGKLKAKKAKQLLQRRLLKLSGKAWDGNLIIKQGLRARGVPESDIEDLLGGLSVKGEGQARHAIEMGEIGEDSVKVSLKESKLEVDRWPREKQQAFYTYIASVREDLVRTRATIEQYLEQAGKMFNNLTPYEQKIYYAFKRAATLHDTELITKLYAKFSPHIAQVRQTGERIPVGLWEQSKRGGTKTPIADPVILKNIEEGNLNADFTRMRDQIAEYNPIILRQGTEQGVFDSVWTKALERQFTKDGKNLYIPARELKTHDAWYKRLARHTGFLSTEGQVYKGVANLVKQGTEAFKGIRIPVNPFDAQQQYIKEMLLHVNNSVAQFNVMQKLLGFTVDKTGKLKMPMLSATEEAIQKAVDKSFFTRVPTYVGRISRHDPNNQFGRLNLDYHNNLPAEIDGAKIASIKRLLNNDDPGMVQQGMAELEMLKNTLVIQHKGDFHIFGNIDPSFRNAIAFDPQLTNWFQRIGNYSGKQMKKFTTGIYTPFSFLSFTYNASIGALNATLKQKGGLAKASKEAIEIWRNGVKGAVDILVTRVSADYATQLSHTIATGLGIGSSQPKLLMKMRDALAARAKRSLLHDYQKEVGSFGAGNINTSAVSADITDHLGSVAPHIYKSYGANALPQFWRVWKFINEAAHQGVSYGVAAQKLGKKIKPFKGNVRNESGEKYSKALRDSLRKAGSDIGDVNLIGASTGAKTATAIVPYFGAAMNAFSAIGRAMYKGGRWGIPRAAAIIGIPATMEYIYNSSLDPDQEWTDANGRKWTYGEYFHQGYNAEQRASNIIMMIPGRPPWEPWVFPVVAEIGMFRALTQDFLDMTLGMSGNRKFDFDGVSGAAHRTFSLPIPIPIKTAISGFLGLDTRAGVKVDSDSGMTSPVQSRLLKANRTTPNLQESEHEGEELSLRVKQMFQDFYGILGSTLSNVGEAFYSGTETTPLSERLAASWDTFTDSYARQAKYVGTLFGGAGLRAANDPALGKRIYKMEEAITKLQKHKNMLLTGGITSTTRPAQGRSEDMTRDPITVHAAITSDAVIKAMAPYKKEISDLRYRITTMKQSRVNEISGIPIPVGSITVKPVSYTHLTLPTTPYV